MPVAQTDAPVSARSRRVSRRDVLWVMQMWDVLSTGDACVKGSVGRTTFRGKSIIRRSGIRTGVVAVCRSLVE